MQQTLLDQGLDLLIFGMGTVFVFLTVLVICTFFMSRLVGRYFPEAPEPVRASAPMARPPVSARTRAIIEAAIREHRAKNK